MNKRVGSIFLLVLLLSSILITISFVSAQDFSSDVQEVGKEIGETLRPILIFLFNIDTAEISASDIGKTIFSFILGFIIIFVFLFLALKKVPLFDEYPALTKIIIVVASLIGVRGIAQIDPELMSQIFLPYTVAGLAIINGAVMIGWFVLINIGLKGEQFNFIRRFMWILFAVIFIGVWWIRRGELSGLLVWTYLATIALAIIIAVLDGSIQGAFAKMQADKIRHIGKTARRAALKSQLKAWEDMLTAGTLSPEDFNILKKNLQAQAKVLGIRRKL